MQNLRNLLSQPLNRSSYMPLYLQLTRQIMKRIVDGDLKSGEKLPSELDIAENLNISRMTVRLAMDELIKNGYIYRTQGKGTFVAEPSMQGVRGFSSFTEDMRSRGLETSSVVLDITLMKPSKNDQFTLKISEQTKVIKLKRLRFVENTPWILQYTTLSSALTPGLENEDLSGSLFQVLREKYQIYPSWTEAKVKASIVLEEESKLLGINLNDPVLVVEGITYTEKFDVVESVKTVYRGDKVSLYMGRQRFGLPLIS